MKKENKKPRCPYCAPTQQLIHPMEYFQSFFYEHVSNVMNPLMPKKLENLLQKWVISGLFGSLRFVGLLTEEEIKPETKIHQRSRMMFDEAKKRGIPMKVFTLVNLPTNFFSTVKKGKTFLFEGLPGLDPTAASTNIDNKENARKLFRSIGAPTPEGRGFTKVEEAIKYGKTIGFPLVVKPTQSSLSSHTSVNLKNEKELREGIRIARMVAYGFIVEKYIEGELYRATTVNGKCIAVARRDPPILVGDGKKTLKQLHDEKQEEMNAMLKSLNYHEHKIPKLPVLPEGERSHILKPGEKKILTWKINISHGASVTDVTEETHPENGELFEAIAKEAKHPIIGIDFIAPDIAVSYKDQRCAVIELNTLPAIDLHYPPAIIGKTQPVAKAVWDWFEEL